MTSRWGTSYLGQDKPLSALTSHEGSRHEYYAQPQDMASYKDRSADHSPAPDRGRQEKEGVALLWVFRVVHLTDVTLESFIRSQGVEVLQVEEVSPRGAAYKSFLVTVHEKDAPTLLHKTFWPGLVSCKYWHEQVEASKGATLSRRSSARSNRKTTLALERERVAEQRKKSDGERPPQILPPLQKVSPKSKTAKSLRRLKTSNNNPGQTKKTARKPKKSISRGAVPSGKITKKKAESRRGSLAKNVGSNDAQGSNRKSSKKEKGNKKEKSKNPDDKGPKERKKKKKVKGSSGEGKAEKEQTTAKDDSRVKDPAPSKKRSSDAKARENIKVRDTGKERGAKGSGTTLGKRQDDAKENRGKQKTVTSGENENKNRESRNPRNEGKQGAVNVERENKPGQGKNSGDKNKGKSQTERKSTGKKQKPDSGHPNERPSNNEPKERQNKDHSDRRAPLSEITVEVSVKEALTKDPDRRSIGEKDRSSRIRAVADGSHSGRGYLYTQETEKDSNRQGYLLPEIPVKSPSFSVASTPSSQGRPKESASGYASPLPDINQHRSNAQAGTKRHPNWVVPLSGLLILSSEEVVYALLGNDFDGLLTQDVISDDELFLGVKVLAHASRAKVREEDLVQLVRKIWQPHVIRLIKTFTVTVERLYPERAERYFWDLAEFLDLYVSRDMHIDQMPNLIDTCYMEVLALSYKSFLSDQIVKVFSVMQSQTKEKGKH
ncbi:serine/arginine repetitive matrix protein 2-like [Macrobrachium nipponense]|uniref:serine/arginine repetitive matrix protein 2-like n=1 Tax=Macrobrachium nipponense TaxID=159736 RepID=UPI0030C8C24A